MELRSALAAFRSMQKVPKKGFVVPRVPVFTAGEDSSSSSDDEPTLEMRRDAIPVAEDNEMTEVDGPPSFADSDHALTERRRR